MNRKQIQKVMVALLVFLSGGYSTFIIAEGAPFALKWTASTGVYVSSGITPLALDVDNDGVMEVFVSGDRDPYDDKIYCFDGGTGKVKWSTTLAHSIAPHCPMEIYDLDKDGTYEIIQPGPNALQVLNAEDGSRYWTNTEIKGSEAYQLVLDTDKTGYPYIYSCNSDDTSPYDGRLRKVDGRTGKILISKTIYYPCHGGLSAADVDNDGDFELFLSDRSTGNGKGIQCYDAETLTLLWNRESIYCASHLPVIVDVNNDGILDVVVSQQRSSNAGIYCLDGRTGSNIAGKCQDSISGLISHETFPIYDVDGDGRLELATCAGSNVKIFDLGSWKIEATLDDDEKPPYYANVMGDSDLEIILSEGVNSIKIYDNQYDLIYTVPNSDSQGSIVNDIDGDGLNELVQISDDGVVRAFDTLVSASNPLPRTNTNNYSERNTRAAVYIPPPTKTSSGTTTNQAPIISTPNLADGQTRVSINQAELSVIIRDPNGDKIDYTIQTNPKIGSKSIQDDEGGTKTCTITGLTYSTTYRWYVNATDGRSWTRKTYTFTTVSQTGNSPPIFSIVTPANGSKNIPIDTTKLLVTIKDPEGNSFDYSIQTYPEIGSKSTYNSVDSTKECRIDGLRYSTTYRWYVNATDGQSWTRRWYTFTTEADPNKLPLDSNEDQDDSSTISTNHPPNRPLILNSTLVIERNVSYNYTVIAIDPDGDQVRFKVNWSDGTFSNWSNFVESNTSIFFNNSWNHSSPANYSISVIAQDINSLNSSWSTPLNVSISKPTSNLFTNITAKQTITFNASEIIDLNVSRAAQYNWNFGDGSSGSGEILNHSYNDAGTYNLSLSVIDIDGNNYTKKITLNVQAKAEIKQYITVSSPSSLYLYVSLSIVLCSIGIGIFIFFRKELNSIFSNIKPNIITSKVVKKNIYFSKKNKIVYKREPKLNQIHNSISDGGKIAISSIHSKNNFGTNNNEIYHNLIRETIDKKYHEVFGS